jgi:pimeloyl-ACP methyl ester carboxylesterase
MATFVLVHGAWVGGWTWKFVASLLRAVGHEVYAPTLTGLGERVHLAHPGITLDTHIQDVVHVLEYEDLDDVVLVGWSYGGRVVASVTHRVPERLSQVIYLDSIVPGYNDTNELDEDEQEQVRTQGDGWLIPPRTEAHNADPINLPPIYIPDETLRHWFAVRRVPHPAITWIQPLTLDNPAAANIPLAYVACTIGWTQEEVATVKQQVGTLGGQFREVAGNHVALLTAPELVARALLQVVSASD